MSPRGALSSGVLHRMKVFVHSRSDRMRLPVKPQRTMTEKFFNRVPIMMFLLAAACLCAAPPEKAIPNNSPLVRFEFTQVHMGTEFKIVLNATRSEEHTSELQS